MTSLLRELGVSPALAVHDVFSLTDADLLAFVPRPALALLLVFPVSAAYESHRLAEDSLLPAYTGRGPAEPVLWFRPDGAQRLRPGRLVHGATNGPARAFIRAFFLRLSSFFFFFF